jgi:hypothetical protein
MKFVGKGKEWSATPVQTPHEVFVCAKIGGVRLARSACGRRFKSLHAERIRGDVRATTAACITCEVGREHSKGRAPTHWSDGMPVTDTLLVPHVALERLVWRKHA